MTSASCSRRPTKTSSTSRCEMPCTPRSTPGTTTAQRRQTVASLWQQVFELEQSSRNSEATIFTQRLPTTPDQDQLVHAARTGACREAI